MAPGTFARPTAEDPGAGIRALLGAAEILEAAEQQEARIQATHGDRTPPGPSPAFIAAAVAGHHAANASAAARAAANTVAGSTAAPAEAVSTGAHFFSTHPQQFRYTELVEEIGESARGGPLTRAVWRRECLVNAATEAVIRGNWYPVPAKEEADAAQEKQ